MGDMTTDQIKEIEKQYLKDIKPYQDKLLEFFQKYMTSYLLKNGKLKQLPITDIEYHFIISEIDYITNKYKEQYGDYIQFGA